jgi:nucleoside-diphosphate-sugar epimerase
MIKALVLGATGLVGSELLRLLLEDPYFDQVEVWSRRSIDIRHPKLMVKVLDFNQIPETDAQIIYSCLGTTKAKTPNVDEYRRLEVEIPIEIARKATRLQQFHYISSIGTSSKAKGSYLKNKWDAEEGLRKLTIESLHIYRPSLIFGQRNEKRTLEGISNILFKWLDPLLANSNYRRIAGSTIAGAMLKLSKSSKKGAFIHESKEIARI